MATDTWPTNAHLVEDCARLGYLRKEWVTLDPTYGLGTFWKRWRPDILVGTDIHASKSSVGDSVDFTHLPYGDRTFDSVVFDPPYKLNGTPTESVDSRYGVHVPRTWQERMELITDGLDECARVLGDGYLLLKCQDQVCSGKVRWQTVEFTKHLAALRLGLVDRFDMLSYRPQPEGRRQVHARRNASTLLIFKRGWTS
jgi:hypothetical protein